MLPATIRKATWFSGAGSQNPASNARHTTSMPITAAIANGNQFGISSGIRTANSTKNGVNDHRMNGLPPNRVSPKPLMGSFWSFCRPPAVPVLRSLDAIRV